MVRSCSRLFVQRRLDRSDATGPFERSTTGPLSARPVRVAAWSSTSSGTVPDLGLAVDRSADSSLGHQVQDALRHAIRSADAALAASGCRRLGSWRINLVCPGAWWSRRTSSCWPRGTSSRPSGRARGSPTAVDRSRDLTPVEVAEREPARVPVPTIDFGYGVPDLRAFSTRDWLWALSDAIKTMPTVDLGDGTVEGDAHLRAVLAGYHRRVRAGCADPAHTIVVGGFRQGLNFVLGALVAHGIERIGLEDPGPRDHDHIARRAGLRVSAVAVDADGVRVDQLRAQRRSRRTAHARAPVPDRGGAEPDPSPRAGAVGSRGRRGDSRGRLRRRVPLRPATGRLASGPRARPRRGAGVGQQDPGAGPAYRLGLHPTAVPRRAS